MSRAAPIVGFAIFLLVLGIQFIRGKWLMFIAGYNTLEPEEREKIDIRPGARDVGIVCLWVSAMCVFWAAWLSEAAGISTPWQICFAVSLAVFVVFLIRAFLNQRKLWLK
jgi:hypothetical protein